MHVSFSHWTWPCSIPLCFPSATWFTLKVTELRNQKILHLPWHGDQIVGKHLTQKKQNAPNKQNNWNKLQFSVDFRMRSYQSSPQRLCSYQSLNYKLLFLYQFIYSSTNACQIELQDSFHYMLSFCFYFPHNRSPKSWF